jgi:hypothetical protein
VIMNNAIFRGITACRLLTTVSYGFLAWLIFGPEDGSDIFLYNSQGNTKSLYPRRQNSLVHMND